MFRVERRMVEIHTFLAKVVRLRNPTTVPYKGVCFFCVCGPRGARPARAGPARARGTQRSFTSITRQQPRATPTAPSAPCAAHIYPERYTHTRALAPRDTHTHTHTGRRAAAGGTLSRVSAGGQVCARAPIKRSISFFHRKTNTLDTNRRNSGLRCRRCA